MLDQRQAATAIETLHAALIATADTETRDPSWRRRLEDAASLLMSRGSLAQQPHPTLPSVGASTSCVQHVAQTDTAVAMGHPDPSVTVLGSPRIGLWFEITASQLLPTPTSELTHVGVGLVLHHLAAASVGETVNMQATVLAVAGRHISFACTATRNTQMIALGIHQRVLRHHQYEPPR